MKKKINFINCKYLSKNTKEKCKMRINEDKISDIENESCLSLRNRKQPRTKFSLENEGNVSNDDEAY